MTVKFVKFITRKMVQSEPNTLFVFGDNLVRKGYGGQAKEMRGEPNAVGIPTKKLPSMDKAAFFTNTEEDYKLWYQAAKNDFLRLILYAGEIVWPTDGIGTGRAKLQTCAPKIYSKILLFRTGLATRNLIYYIE